MRTDKRSSIFGCLSLLFSLAILTILAFAFFGFEDPPEPLESGNIEKWSES